MYLEIFLADFAVFRVFGGISRDFAEMPEFRGSATARNIRSPDLSRQQNSRANTNQESLTLVWRVQFSYTIIYKNFFLKINTTFHFLLEKNLHRPNKPKACHSEMSITPGL